LSRKIGNIELVEYGELPQVIASGDIRKELEEGLQANKLTTITKGEGFPYDGEAYDAYDKPFKLVRAPAYSCDGKKYSRFLARPHDRKFEHDRNSVLSNGRDPKYDEVCWLEYAPWEWMRDKSGWWISYLVVVAGIKFSEDRDYYGDLSKTNMYNYLGYLLPKVDDFTYAQVCDSCKAIGADRQDNKSLCDNKDCGIALDQNDGDKIQAQINRVELIANGYKKNLLESERLLSILQYFQKKNSGSG
jgi:hypothetical protein